MLSEHLNLFYIHQRFELAKRKLTPNEDPLDWFSIPVTFQLLPPQQNLWIKGNSKRGEFNRMARETQVSAGFKPLLEFRGEKRET